MHLEQKPVLRLSDVQERWNVSLRTFRRDLARLRDAGFIIDPASTMTATDHPELVEGRAGED
jgi:DeoR/GlpR family transcriptional regulator of sugar metabolism